MPELDGGWPIFGPSPGAPEDHAPASRAPGGRHPYEPLSRRRALANCDPGGRALAGDASASRASGDHAHA